MRLTHHNTGRVVGAVDACGSDVRGQREVDPCPVVATGECVGLRGEHGWRVSGVVVELHRDVNTCRGLCEKVALVVAAAFQKQPLRTQTAVGVPEQSRSRSVSARPGRSVVGRWCGEVGGWMCARTSKLHARLVICTRAGTKCRGRTVVVPGEHATQNACQAEDNPRHSNALQSRSWMMWMHAYGGCMSRTYVRTRYLQTPVR